MPFRWCPRILVTVHRLRISQSRPREPMLNVFEQLQRAPGMQSGRFGVEIAVVTNVQDPDKVGRVKVKFPRLPNGPESDWARVAQPSAGAGRGFYWIPEVNDEVLVAFELGNANRP